MKTLRVSVRAFHAAIDKVRVSGNSCGGEVTCVVRAPPVGLGYPVFDKLEAELAKALMSLPATKVGKTCGTPQFLPLFPEHVIIVGACRAGNVPMRVPAVNICLAYLRSGSCFGS